MKIFRYGVSKKVTVLEELARHGYRLYEYDPRRCYNYYTFIVDSALFVTRTYFFNENDILIKVRTK